MKSTSEFSRWLQVPKEPRSNLAGVRPGRVIYIETNQPTGKKHCSPKDEANRCDNS